MIFSEGMVFGGRTVLRANCEENDFLSIGIRVPNRIDKYVLGKCNNCGRVLPTRKADLIKHPPKRCMYCSNIGNHFSVETSRNSWNVVGDTAYCNVEYSGVIVQFFVDSDMYEELSSYIWRISKKKTKYYVTTGSGHKGTLKYLHNIVVGDAPEGLEVDHIDGNSLNNKKSNLRFISHIENIHNIRANRIDNQIGIRGISFDSKKKLFVVDLSFNNHRYYVKPWKTLEQAVWCRHIFEDYFNLPMLNYNPLFEQYNTLQDKEKEEIKNYTLSKILGN